MNQKSQAATIPNSVALSAIAGFALMFLAGRLAAQSPIIEPVLPQITETTAKGVRRTVPTSELWPLDIGLSQRFQRTDAPDEVFAFQDVSLNGGEYTLTEIIVRGDEAELRFYPDDCPLRYFHRKLSGEELKQLRQFVTNNAVDRLKEHETEVCDGVGYDYIHLTRIGGYRLWMNNPPEGDDLRALPANDPTHVYGHLVAMFAKLADPDRLKIEYFGTRLPQGLEVLFAHPKQEVRLVWAKGDDIRVLVGDCHMWPEEWRSLRKGQLGPAVAAPEGFPPTLSEHSLHPIDHNGVGLDLVTDRAELWQTGWGKKMICGGRIDWQTYGTWICETGKKPERLFDSAIADQLVTPDGHWLIGTLDKKLICFDLVKRKTVPIDDAETVETFCALYYLHVPKQVLLVSPGRHDVRAPLLPPDQVWLPATYRLLNPTTGKTTELKDADAGSLRQPMRRPPQSTGEPGVVWLATGATKDHGLLGRFDTRTFRFRKWTSVEKFHFDNDNVWVDESTKSIYIIYRGHLLRLPLPSEVFEDWK